MFGSRVSWLSWFRAYAECNPYNRAYVSRVALSSTRNESVRAWKMTPEFGPTRMVVLSLVR